MHFGIKIETVTTDTIAFRVWSQEKVCLKLRDFKFFYKPKVFDRVERCFPRIALENNYKVISFTVEERNKPYISFNFIVMDKTNKEQYAVRISMITKHITYTKMFYEGC